MPGRPLPLSDTATKPLIIQSDHTILLEVQNDLYQDARDEISRFAELEKSPEHFHTYRITPLSIWNAAASGLDGDALVSSLERLSKYEVTRNVIKDLRDYVDRYGRVRLEREDESLVLVSDDPALITEILHNPLVREFVLEKVADDRVAVDPAFRGHIKQAMIKIGFPVEDLAGYKDGGHLDVRLRRTALSGTTFDLRPYQWDSVEVFHAGGSERGGSGVIVLPCGAGKTIVGMGAMHKVSTKTLILTTNLIAVRQWQQELLDKTHLTEDDVGEYTGEVKNVKSVTVTTYQILTYRRSRTEPFVHFDLFRENDWGLIIYDEVHLLPAPVFRITAEIQATRRLGLTATLIREDGREDEVFTLIGPKKYDVPWKVLERQGWIATAVCTEVRVALPQEMRIDYAMADKRSRFRLAAENPDKFPIVQRLLQKHEGDRILIIGQYLDQLRRVARDLRAPLITGKTPNKERAVLYDQLRSGELSLLLVSKVGNFALDLPDANVLIQISGTFGSRQEEAQRLGRILRPKSNGSLAHFYTLVTRDSRDQDFSANRQRFLTEQGYSYEIMDGREV
jgi:DNA excision repair protein ERCC-3